MAQDSTSIVTCRKVDWNNRTNPLRSSPWMAVGFLFPLLRIIVAEHLRSQARAISSFVENSCLTVSLSLCARLWIEYHGTGCSCWYPNNCLTLLTSDSACRSCYDACSRRVTDDDGRQCVPWVEPLDRRDVVAWTSRK